MKVYVVMLNDEEGRAYLRKVFAKANDAHIYILDPKNQVEYASFDVLEMEVE